ncbi:HEAT repeat domain-containing protein [candidate division KSB1 bacterium]|nr:HEAT repeat domain-containing protein [candidate division KSB1 bacterium]
MNEQNRLRELLPLYDSDELTPQERREVEAWLRNDADAQAELEAIRVLHRRLEGVRTYEPAPHTLLRLRDRLFENLENTNRKAPWFENLRTAWFGNTRPAWQLGFALALLFAGLLLGRQFFPRTMTAVQPAATDLLPLLLAQQPIATGQSVYSPRLANVHKIRLDQNTNQIEIEFSTVNNISLRGTAEDPIVRQVLAHAMREEEPAGMRLRAVKAMGEAVPTNLNQEDELVDAVLQMLADDPNAGVRMKAVQALKQIAATERVKQALIQTLLHDNNAGVRIAALEALSGVQFADEKLEALEAAASDTNGYIRREATRMLETVRSGNVQ